jgi:hypothetical protein
MLCVFDDAIQTEGAFRLVVDGAASLLRQRVFRLQLAERTTQKPAACPDIFGSFLVAPQPGRLKISRVLIGGAISFNLFAIACALIGGGRVHSAQHPQIYGDQANPVRALTPSDLMSVSDECAAGINGDCAVQSARAAGVPDSGIPGVQPRLDELPFPSGRFGVAQVSYSFSPSLKLFVWYPAAIDPDTSLPVHNVWSFSRSMAKFVQTHTVENAAIAAGHSRFPLILFSPAAGNESAAYLSQIENLVSHGYIVASLQSSEAVNAISFQDTRLTTFEADMRQAFLLPENRSIETALAHVKGFEQNRDKMESAKLRFAFNRMILIATDRSRSAPFAGRIDLEHVGAFGHASGGNAVAQLCTSDARISACLDEDGWTPNGLLTEANPGKLPRQPFLWIDMPLKRPDEAELTYAHITRDQFTRLVKASAARADLELNSFAGGAYRVSLLRSDWDDKNFTDGPLVWSMKRGQNGDAGARIALAVANVYSKTFFDKYLKGRPAPLLDSNTNSPFTALVLSHSDNPGNSWKTRQRIPVTPGTMPMHAGFCDGHVQGEAWA